MSAIIPNSASTSMSHNETKQFILARLLDSVKQCQIRYGGRTELASERDSCVADLCGSLEAVLCHGMRSNPLTKDLRDSTLKQMSHLITSRLSLGNEGQVFWHYVALHLTKHERERYAMLKRVYTDIGKGRAWIRGTLNEKSLERYLHCLLGSQELLDAYYEEWGLLRDQERSSMLPNMAAGLNSILFAINIDNPDLNVTPIFKSYLSNSHNEPIIVTSVPKPVEHRQNRRAVKQIISFDDDDDDVLNSEVYASDARSESTSTVQSVGKEADEFDTERSDQKSTVLSPVHESGVDVLIPVVQTSEITVSEELPSQELVSDGFECDNSANEVDDVSRIQSLIKENETLKSQLKRYVSAVQMLKKDGAEAHRALAALSGNLNILDYHREVKQYESKLIQVAEMHAELMEFNEHLQKQINYKDQTISKLRHDLTELRGGVLTDDEMIGEVSISIPSAFLTGSGSDAYHVYQVYIRAGVDEWNIYRRYAQFFTLHTELKKLDPAVGQFDFPPKKTIGNKDLGLVEKRRRKLQMYLRRVLRHWPELAACSSRAALQQHLAFFRDTLPIDKLKKPKQPGMFSSSSSSRSTSTSSTETHYNGL